MTTASLRQEGLCTRTYAASFFLAKANATKPEPSSSQVEGSGTLGVGGASAWTDYAGKKFASLPPRSVPLVP